MIIPHEPEQQVPEFNENLAILALYALIAVENASAKWPDNLEKLLEDEAFAEEFDNTTYAEYCILLGRFDALTQGQPPFIIGVWLDWALDHCYGPLYDGPHHPENWEF